MVPGDGGGSAVEAGRAAGGPGARSGAGAGARPGALLVVGDVITDVVARHRGPLTPGTDTAAAVRTVPGGAGANVACRAACWGDAEVRLLGRVGEDAAAWTHGSWPPAEYVPCWWSMRRRRPEP
ncbi:hypothetical protein SHIRM173S_05745 [Streptomyces hirsutus]